MDVDILSVISRWAHVGTAILLVGGTFFIRYVLHPALDSSTPEQNTALMDRVRNRWKRFVHGGIALFFASGLFNYMKAIPSHKGDAAYHALVGTKMILALGIFFLASALVGRSKGTQKFRDQAPKWTAIVVLLSFVIVAISGLVKVRGVPDKPGATAVAQETPAP